MLVTLLILCAVGVRVTGKPTQGPIDYGLLEHLHGVKFQRAFNWETGGGWDNGGIPLYVTAAQARRNNMWTVLPETGQNIFRVYDKANVSPYRMSTRISTKKSYSGGGLFVFDVAHIPTGYGLWPALWMVGVPDWPNMGEIDVIEGVHATTKNTQSYHTSTGCIMQKSGFTNSLTRELLSPLWPNSPRVDVDCVPVASDLKYDCDAYAAENQGCSTRDGDAQSYGAPFNAKGGGVFVVQWDSNGIAMYSFPRDSVPADIASGRPIGVGWGTPTAYLSNASCPIFDNFYQMKIVLNTNLYLWYAGSPGSPANKTRVADCETYVLRGGYYALKEAYWTINSIKVYNQTTLDSESMSLSLPSKVSIGLQQEEEPVCQA
ncbi:uncharacterized protein JCM15063_004597 [Sporobolomyces koalae]|uniref:uncharacterized protein n=1 Tax=Sporobolomyces koalae TaxID=500713 RepID=UPI003179986A